MIPSTHRRSSTLPLLGALLLAAAGAGIGCERIDPAQLAIDKANIDLDAQSVAGANPVFSAKQRTTTFNGVVNALKPIADSGDPAHAAAASLLIARAKSGLGEIAAAEAADVERQFLASATVTRALVSQWSSQHATAASLGRYDPSKDLADLEKEINSKTSETAVLMADRSKQEAAVAAIRAQADKAKADAKLERTREAGIRKSAEGQSQTAREAIITQAVAASRAADALDKKAAELSAEAAKEAPKVEEIANQIERLEAQVDSLKKAKENIQQRATAAREQSAKASTEANAVGATITSSLNSLATLRESASKPAKDAVARYTEASSGATKSLAGATKEGKTAAQALLGASQQSLADTLGARVRSLSIYSNVLTAAATAKPAIPGQADTFRRADDVAAELTTARADAEAAYEKARTAYAAAGGSGDLQIKLKAVADALERLKTERNKPVELPKPKAADPVAEKPADAKPADSKPEAAAAPALTAEQTTAIETEVRAALKEISAASAAGDFQKVVAHIATSSDAEKDFLQASLPVGVAAKTLDSACTAKYGKDLAALVKECQVPAVKGNPMFMMMGAIKGSAAGGVMGVADASEQAVVKAVSATEAEAATADGSATAKLKKEDNVWKLTGLGGAMASAGPMAAQMLPALKGISEAFTKVAAGIIESKYATSDDMLTDLSAQLMGAMGGGMGGPRPRPGSGAAPKPAPGG